MLQCIRNYYFLDKLHCIVGKIECRRWSSNGLCEHNILCIFHMKLCEMNQLGEENKVHKYVIIANIWKYMHLIGKRVAPELQRAIKYPFQSFILSVVSLSIQTISIQDLVAACNSIYFQQWCVTYSLKRICASRWQLSQEIRSQHFQSKLNLRILNLLWFFWWKFTEYWCSFK